MVSRWHYIYGIQDSVLRYSNNHARMRESLEDDYVIGDRHEHEILLHSQSGDVIRNVISHDVTVWNNHVLLWCSQSWHGTGQCWAKSYIAAMTKQELHLGERRTRHALNSLDVRATYYCGVHHRAHGMDQWWATSCKAESYIAVTTKRELRCEWACRGGEQTHHWEGMNRESYVCMYMSRSQSVRTWTWGESKGSNEDGNKDLVHGRTIETRWAIEPGRRSGARTSRMVRLAPKERGH